MIQPSKLQNKPYLKKKNKESKELIKQFKEEKTKSPTVVKYITRKKREGWAREGGSPATKIAALGTKALRYATNALSKVLPGLATGVLNSLESFGMDKILGQGVQTGGFLVPQNKIDRLIAHKHLLSTKQKQDILNALQTGNGVVIRPTRKQSGGAIGKILASIGIQLLLKALTRKGLQIDRHRPKKSLPVCVPDDTGRGLQVDTPFFRFMGKTSWNGIKKKNIPKGKKGTAYWLAF